MQHQSGVLLHVCTVCSHLPSCDYHVLKKDVSLAQPHHLLSILSTTNSFLFLFICFTLIITMQLKHVMAEYINSI